MSKDKCGAPQKKEKGAFKKTKQKTEYQLARLATVPKSHKRRAAAREKGSI